MVLSGLKEWGWKGALESGKRGALRSFGWNEVKGGAGKFAFLGGASPTKALRGAAIGLGLGYAAYKATDNPLVGIGAGVLTAKLAGTPLLPAIGIYSSAYSIIEGFKTGGFSGGISSGI